MKIASSAVYIYLIFKYVVGNFYWQFKSSSMDNIHDIKSSVTLTREMMPFDTNLVSGKEIVSKIERGAKTAAVKAGMMQELLTGRTRLT